MSDAKENLINIPFVKYLMEHEWDLNKGQIIGPSFIYMTNGILLAFHILDDKMVSHQ